MTDKQIIIDGVDVSRCTNYADGKCTNSNIMQSNCKNVAVCYYKEYKRKEQECEELKKKCNIYTCCICGNKEYCNKLYKTLTEIKEIAEKAKKDICNNCGWRNTDSCDAEDYTCGEFIKILQKISEVENGHTKED